MPSAKKNLSQAQSKNILSLANSNAISVLMDNALINYSVIDCNGNYIAQNRHMMNNITSGLTKAQDIDLPSWESCLEAMREKKRIVKEEKFKDRYYLSIKQPIYQDDKCLGIVVLSFDVTEHKQAEEALMRAKAAEEASEFKSQFMQNMEHDLRTPTLGMIGSAEALEENATTPVIKEKSHDLIEAGKQLLRLLNDIIHASHAQAGKFPVSYEEIDLLKSINGIIALQRPVTDAKNLKLIFNHQPDVPKIILSDEHRISRILLNLIGNAIKFTKEGLVKVGLAVAEKTNDQRVVLKLTVEDTGIGIPQELQRVMYERFVRGTPSNRGRYSGSGLGLSIVKQFVQELGGEIRVESKVGKGTTFTCLIPVAIPQALSPSKPSVVQSHVDNSNLAIKILLVEDSPTVKDMGMRILRKNLPAAQIDTAETGRTAIDLAAKNSYDIIFMDLGLPDIDGYEVTKAIHKIFPDAFIVALTAQAANEAKCACLNTGMYDAFEKPIDDEKIQAIVQSWKNQKSGAANNQNTKNKVIDWMGLSCQTCGDAKLAQDLLEQFAKDLPIAEQDIKAAISVNDFKKISFIAIKIKGASLYCHTAQITTLMEDLYQAAQNQNKKLIKEIFKQFKSAIQEVITAVAGYEW